MKADLAAQHALLAVAESDTQLRQLAHRSRKQPEAERLAEAKASVRTLADEAAVVAMRIEDLDREIARLESDVDAVRQREERDEQLLRSGELDSRVQSDVQHELGSLRRRQSAFEDELLELMQQREEEQAALAQAQERRSAAEADAQSAESALAAAQDQIKTETAHVQAERVRRAEAVPGELLALYERLRARREIAAARLDGRRCGACRLEIDAAELSQIKAAPPDEVARCPECEAILVRVAA
jgi:hypothetical protein